MTLLQYSGAKKYTAYHICSLCRSKEIFQPHVYNKAFHIKICQSHLRYVLITYWPFEKNAIFIMRSSLNHMMPRLSHCFSQTLILSFEAIGILSQTYSR